MEVNKLKNVIRLVRDILQDQKITAEEQLQLNKICELEDKFVKGFSKDKWREYFDLDVEKGQLVNLQIDQVIKITFEVCKRLFIGK